MTSDRWDRIARDIEDDPSALVGSRIANVARSTLAASAVGLMRVVGDGRGAIDGGEVEGGMFDEAQMILGEGPTIDAIGADSPILVEDLTTPDAVDRWPGFVPRAAELGVLSLFAFPMRIGGVRVGVLSAYRAVSGPLTTMEYADGLVVASLASLLLMDDQDSVEGGFSAVDTGDLASHSRLQIAAGMVSEQLDVSVADALVRLRAHAYVSDLRLDDVSRAVIDRTLVLDP